MSPYRSTALLLLSTALVWAHTAGQGKSQSLTYQKDILPIFQQSCAKCHLGNAAMGKLQLTSEEGLLRGGVSGPAIVPGKSSESLLVKRLLGLSDAPRMPMGGTPLSDAQVNIIRTWIDEGAHHTETAANAIATKTKAAADSPLFAEKVRPILASRCYGCHGPALQQNGLRLDSLAAILKGSDNGKIIIPGKPDGSRLIRRLRAQERPMMPYGGPALASNEIEIIRNWIAAGAPGPDSSASLPMITQTPKHWAYVKPVRPEVPQVKNASWPRNPIDNFILAKLESEGLKPSPEAGKRTLIRRVYLDLIGLPPTPAEVDVFVSDQSPDAYEKVVDRLQDSPRYGERWARPWLDLARYADSNGYEKDNPRVAWEYRDWVIRALNADMPFNEFTIEQIAGDMLPNPTKDQLIATGFHRNSMLNQEGGIDVEEYYFYSQVDRVNTTASVWLGSTLGCAQCHNHKFDPFPQKDYYRMIAFFNNSDHHRAGNGDYYMAEPTLELPDAEQAKKSEELRTQIASLEKMLATQTPELDSAQQTWETEAVGAEKRWSILKPSKLESQGGATLALQSDNSVLASGKNPQADTYHLTATTDLTQLSGVRLEVLPDPGLPHSGPGRDPDGNFFLSDFEMQINGQPVIFKSAQSDESQSGYSAKGIVEKRPGSLSGWAVDTGDKTWRRQVVFLPRDPTVIPSGATLTFTLRHEMRKTSRNIGRFRLSLTSDSEPDFIIQVPAALRAALAKPVSERTPEENQKLAEAYRQFAPSLDPTRKQLASLEKDLNKLGIPTAMIMKEDGNFSRPSAHLRERGTFTSPGELVYADVPSALNPLPKDVMPNRLGLAKWLVSEDNPLTARVTVNHFWETIFGRGIVETSEDFGSQGDPPSHPELLDWLATEFMRQGWDMKKMQKLMVMSATYRQDSHVSPELEERDPYNRLYARGPRFRVEAEMVHDVVLAESGLLSSKMFGPPVYPYQPEGVWDIPYSDDKWVQSTGEDQYRRSVYTFLRRSSPYPSLTTYDAPSREFCTVRRVRTNTPLQALTSLNDPYFFESARALAKRLVAEGGPTLADQISYGFRITVSRPPTASELAKVTGFYQKQLTEYQANRSAALKTISLKNDDNAPEMAALTMVANVLLNMDEAVTKE